jgi:hypothetical protein
MTIRVMKEGRSVLKAIQRKVMINYVVIAVCGFILFMALKIFNIGKLDEIIIGSFVFVVLSVAIVRSIIIIIVSEIEALQEKTRLTKERGCA